MKFDSIPPEFQGLVGKVDFVQRVNSTEWSSSCPHCGTTGHNKGISDRFRMFTNANGKNKVMGWCRRCSYVWFPKNDIPPTPEEFEKWRKEQLAIEEHKKREAEKAIAQLKSQKIWEFYQSELNEWAYEVLDSWGICKENVGFWKLGLIKDYTVYPEQYHSPAISIPVWGFDWEVRNVKVRVLNPKSHSDRYRALYKIGKDVIFVARPDLKSDVCMVVEGEKKAMVVAASKQNIQVVGVPTVTPSAESLKELERFGKIILCLDPDSKYAKNGLSPLKRMVDILGKDRVQTLNLPGKIDDLILKHNLDLEDALRYVK